MQEDSFFPVPPKQIAHETIYTKSTAAEFLGVAPMRVLVLIQEGRIKATRLEDGSYQITESALLEYQNTPPLRGTRKNGKKTNYVTAYTVKLTPDQYLQAKTFFDAMGVEITTRYLVRKEKAMKDKAARLAKAKQQVNDS